MQQDTVIDAGKYDGPLGIVAAIAAVKVLKMEGKLQQFPRPIEVGSAQLCFHSRNGVMPPAASSFLAHRTSQLDTDCACRIQIIAFSDEEGVRFHTTFLGSSAVAGTFKPKYLMGKDAK